MGDGILWGQKQNHILFESKFDVDNSDRGGEIWRFFVVKVIAMQEHYFPWLSKFIHQYFHNSSSSKDRCGADSKLEHGYRDASSCSGHSCQNNNNITRAGAKICLFFTLLLQSLTSGMLAPPRGKTGCPAPPREKQALPRPAPQKWQNPRGATGKSWLWIAQIMPTNLGLE